jgi:tetratricopeptide (TPR) repeat protein
LKVIAKNNLCILYPKTEKRIGYVAAQLNDNQAFIADISVVYYNVSTVISHVTWKKFDFYLEAYAKRYPTELGNKQKIEQLLRTWPNNNLPNGGIEEVRLIDAHIANNDEAWYLEGMSLVESGNVSGGIDHFFDIITKYKTSDYAPLASYQLGEVYFKQTNYFTALIWYANTVDDYPGTNAAEEAKKQILKVCLVKPGKTNLPNKTVIDCDNLDQTKYYPGVKT